MRRRPSPALVIACIALFLALSGAGFAASLALVRSVQPVALVPGSVSADGKVTGTRLTGERVSQGVYTLTINGPAFGQNGKASAVRTLVTPQVITIAGSNRVVAPTCDTSGTGFASDGSRTVQVSCFAFDPATGWAPIDASFDVQFAGSPR
jgi:hypothetical protein